MQILGVEVEQGNSCSFSHYMSHLFNIYMNLLRRFILGSGRSVINMLIGYTYSSQTLCCNAPGKVIGMLWDILLLNKWSSTVCEFAMLPQGTPAYRDTRKNAMNQENFKTLNHFHPESNRRSSKSPYQLETARIWLVQTR